MEKLEYNGLRSKTINIRTYTGSTEFAFQQSNELGLPKNSIIVGFMARQHSGEKISSNNKPLVNADVFDNAYLNIKCHIPGKKIALILSDYYLPFAVDRTIFIEPTNSSFFDWNESFISINDRALPKLINNSVIEINVLYREFDQNICSLPNYFKFRTGEELLGTRRDRKEISLIVDQSEYPLSDTTSFGLPKGAWVVGFSTRNTEFPQTGEPMNSKAFDSSYITLKRKTDCFIESFPVELENYQDTLFPALDYFPIEPTPVLNVDWESSKLEIKDVSTIVKGQVFQIELVYVMAENNDLLTTSV